MNRYLFIVLFTMTLHNSSAQSLDKYADQLYFGMLSFNPDTSINDFLTRYVPQVFRKIDTGGTWTMYPPGGIKEPEFYKVTNSYVFTRHPYFTAYFKSGQLAITQKIYSDEKWNGGITDVRLWFEFDKENDAKKALTQLVDTLSSFNTFKKLTSQQGIDRAEFTDKQSEKYYGSVQVILVTDYSLGKRFVMPSDYEAKIITEAGYKILIEVGVGSY